jgi:hypothetical protein
VLLLLCAAAPPPPGGRHVCPQQVAKPDRERHADCASLTSVPFSSRHPAPPSASSQARDLRQRQRTCLMVGSEMVVEVKGPGQVVGEVYMQEAPPPCNYSARARGDVLALKLTQENYVRALASMYYEAEQGARASAASGGPRGQTAPAACASSPGLLGGSKAGTTAAAPAASSGGAFAAAAAMNGEGSSHGGTAHSGGHAVGAARLGSRQSAATSVSVYTDDSGALTTWPTHVTFGSSGSSLPGTSHSGPCSRVPSGISRRTSSVRLGATAAAQDLMRIGSADPGTDDDEDEAAAAAGAGAAGAGGA